MTTASMRRLIALPAALLFLVVLVGAPATSAAPATELVSLAITNADGSTRGLYTSSTDAVIVGTSPF